MAKFARRMANILVKSGLLTLEQAEEAEAGSEDDGKSFTEILLDKGFVSEKELVGAVAREMDIPPIDLAKVQVEASTLEVLPQDMAKHYGVLPVAKIGNVLTIAVSNPFDILKLDDVQIVTKCDLRPVVSSERAIDQAISRAYNPGESEMKDLVKGMVDGEVEEVATADDDQEDVDLSDLTQSKDSPVVKLVNLLIFQAVRTKASDIHIEPFQHSVRVRFRQDGVLYESLSPPKRLQNAIASRIKVMADLDIAEKRRPQDGKFQLRIEGRQVDFRVSILPVVHGEKIVMRILDASNLAISLDTLGFEAQALNAIRKAVSSPWGMLLVTGPTGSGKSTTLYSCVREVMSIEDNIVTVEDPVEYQVEGINQVPVNPKRGLTFAGALRSILRQDPDTVMIGEIRDLETAEIAIKAALTGHLVFSTLHTNDAASTITRLVDMGVDPFMVASAIVLVVAQRLGRSLCEECKEPLDPPLERLLEVGFKEEEVQGVQLYTGAGCNRCKEGYKGRFALLEPLEVTDEIKRLIIKGGSAMDIKKQAAERGMVSLRRCGLLNVLRGRTSIEEVLRVTIED